MLKKKKLISLIEENKNHIQSKHGLAKAVKLRLLSSRPADCLPIDLAIRGSCFIRLCCLLSRRPLGFLQSLSLTLMGSDVAHDWNCQRLDEGQLKNGESAARALVESAAGLFAAAALAHSTFTASDGENRARQRRRDGNVSRTSGQQVGGGTLEAEY